MSFEQIETGYKPQFGLGALYHGFNAANADQLSEQEILKAFLSNQKQQYEQPLDMIVKQWDAAHAQDKLDSPDYRKAMIDGYIGQMNSQIAAGRKGMGTVDTEIPAINQENRNKQFLGKTLEDWNNLRLGQQQEQQQALPTKQSSNIGFDMQPSQVGNISKQADMLKSFGTDYKNAPDMPAYDDMINQINRGLSNPKISNKDKQDLLREKQRILNELRSTPTNIQPSVEPTLEQPQNNNNNNLLTRFQNILVNTPEHLQKLEALRVMGENSNTIAETRGQYMLQAALSRVQKNRGENLDTTVARATRILAGMEEGDKEAAAVVMREAGNFKLRGNPASYNGNNLNLPATQQTGKIQNAPSAVQQAGALTINGGVPSIVPGAQGTGTKSDPIKLR